MATTTPNYNLRKPAPADTVNVETDIGANMDIIDAALAAKADEEHAHEEYATDADVTTAVSTAVTGVIDAAPGALNTLNELAAALGDDANFASSVTTALAAKADTGHDHDADYEATGAIATHTADSTAVHGIADTALLITAATHALIDHDDLPGIEANIPIQNEAPADPELHDLWVDEDEPAPSGGGGGAAIAYQAEAPDNPAEGDLWADSDETTPAQSGSSVVIDVAHKRRTAGDITVNNTSWTDLDNNLDLVLTAAIGDEVWVSASGFWGNAGVYAFLDCVSIVGGSPVNSWASNGAPNASGQGVRSWWGKVSSDEPIGGTVARTLVSGDISSGTVTLRLRYRTFTATNRTFLASTADQFCWGAQVLRPPA